MFVAPEVWPPSSTHVADPFLDYRTTGRRLILTHSGRTAFDLALDVMGVQPGDEVLIPAIRDGSQVSVAKRRGIAPVFYRVDGNLRADLGDLERLIGSRTRVVYLIHYLGWPQQPRAVRAVCAQRGVRLLEDFAHAVFSRDDDVLLGTFGDVSIASLRKALGLPDGGLLMINQPDLPDPAPLRAAPVRAVAERAARLLALTHLPQRLLRVALQRALITAGPSTEWEFRDSQRGAAMSRWSERLLHRVDPASRVESMRKAFELFAAEWPDVEWAKPLRRSVEPGVCPRMFALLCPDRARVQRALHKAGIVAYRLWHRSAGSDPGKEFPEARAFMEHVLGIPLRDGLDSSIAPRIVAIMNREMA